MALEALRAALGREDRAPALGLALHRQQIRDRREPLAFARLVARHRLFGHHPHVLSGFEVYRGGLILYSLGNFVFDYREFPRPKMSVILSLELSKAGPFNLDMTPIHIIDEQPRVAKEEYKYRAPRLGKDETLFSGSEIIDRQYRMTAALMSGQAEKAKEPGVATRRVTPEEKAVSEYVSEGGGVGAAEASAEEKNGITFDP